MSADDDSAPAWSTRPSTDEVAGWYRSAIAARPELADERSLVFHDLDLQSRRFDELTAAFPSTALHAVAVKANPIVAVLRRLVEQGAGLETASIEEVHVALAAGCAPERIVFDSPAKTPDELRFALERGMTVNVDNADELRAALRVERHPSARLGLRINPGAGDGTIAATSVGGANSRFGFDLAELTEHVLQLPEGARIDGLHVHVGSQGCELSQLVDGVVAADDVRGAVEERFGHGLSFLDVGGGLPTDYTSDTPAPTIQEYAAALAETVPDLWGSDVQLVTELGRALLAGCGVAVSGVEYVKTTGAGRRVAVIHLGADFLLRAAYAPQNWPYRFTVLDAPDGAATDPFDVAGPLCFAGDVIGRDVDLPSSLSPGDRVAIHDVGAYSISMWSRHCSRGIPAVIGVEADGSFPTLLAPERPADVAAFWSRGAS